MVMKHAMTEEARGNGLGAGILLEQARVLFNQVPFSVNAILANSLLLAYVQWEVTSHRSILGWLALMAVVSVARFWQYFRFRRANPAPTEGRHWYRQALYSSLLSAFAWGAGGILLFPPDSFAHQLFLILVIAGISAGAVTTLSSVFPVLVLFLALNLAPMALRFLLQEGELEKIIGGMLLFFMSMLMLSARRLNRMIHETLAARQEKCQAEATIRHQALYDELTDLPNRRMLFDQLDREITRARRHGFLEAILFLDLDYFKHVNDSLGHAVGDRLLQQVARRLTARIRNEDMVARLGGDEFVILLSRVGSTTEEALDSVSRFATDLRQLLQAPFQVGNHTLHVSASIGIVLFPLDDSTSGDLLQQADVAMYRAKEEGRDGFCLFHPGMQEALESRLEIQLGLRRALAEGRLELHYQPQVDMKGNILGAEALVRWHHPRRGLVSPAEFVPIAEETGLIYPLGEWVLDQACAHIRRLADDRPMIISVNISPKQFREPNFVEQVKSAVTESGIEPGLLHLEITESTLLDNVEQAITRMEALKDFGIGFSIDDFGTGYSSLAYLKRLPIEALKIDRSFVLDVIEDNNDAVLVETIIVMASHLGLEVIAEGVETREVLDFLWQKGCRKFQGYLFSQPLPFEELRLLRPPLLRPEPAPAKVATMGD